VWDFCKKIKSSILQNLCQFDRIFVTFSGRTRNEYHRKSNENNN